MIAVGSRRLSRTAARRKNTCGPNTVVINARCSLRIEADQRVIVVAGLPVHHYRGEDAVAEACAMKQPGDRAPAAVSRCR
jgi:hypothetical protein